MATTQSAVAVVTANELIAAVNQGVSAIEVDGRICGVPSFTLSPGQTLSGRTSDSTLVFDGDGIGITGDNCLSNMHLVVPDQHRVVELRGAFADRGVLQLAGITCHGQVALIFGDETARADVRFENVGIVGADTRHQTDRAQCGSTEILQGAITIWNRSAAPSHIAFSATGLDIGFSEKPVKGSGLLIAGGDRQGKGRVVVNQVQIRAIHIDSGLTNGASAACAGGICIMPGVEVDSIRCDESVIARGVNAVPIDNRGAIDLCLLRGSAISHGMRATGFNNAGYMGRLDIGGSIETFGDGASGCSISGPVKSLRAHAIITHGAAATAVRISDRLDYLEVEEAIVTIGPPGSDLVAGAIHQTPAHAIHIESGGVLGALFAEQILASGRAALPFVNEGRFG